MKENVDNVEDSELGNYRILSKDGALWTLGKGTFGTTYKAEHRHLGGAYALKIINDQFNDSEQVKQRFLREAKATFSLSSTKIARVHDFGVEDGVFYYVLDYCDGGNLQEYSLKNGPQPWSVVRNLALQILEAVSEAHQNGFLHRDLKPSNIMLQKPDDIDSLKLIDFGMVKALEDSGVNAADSMLTVQGSFMGNALTASPEQLHEQELDERSDLFSLGVTLWYILCGGSPFGEAATASLVHTRLQDEEYTHKLPDDLPDDGKFILGKLLNKKKEERFATAEEVISAIQNEECGSVDHSEEEAEVAEAPAITVSSSLQNETLEAPSAVMKERVQEKKTDSSLAPVTEKEQPQSSRSKLMGFVAAALLVAVGFLGYQEYISANPASSSDTDSKFSADNTEPKEGEAGVTVENLDPEERARNEEKQKELIAHITEIKTLVEEKQYTLAQTKIEELEQGEAKIDTSRLKQEITQLIEEESAFQKKQKEVQGKLAERQATLKDKEKQARVKAEKEAKEAKKIWDEEASVEREMLRLANEQREKTLNYIATNQPRVQIKKRSENSGLWEAKVVLKRPDNQPKEITLKFSKNKLLNKTSDALVKVIGPHIEKVDGNRQLNWELIVIDAVLDKKQQKQNNLVNEQKKRLLLKEHSIRKKYPQYGKYFPY